MMKVAPTLTGTLLLLVLLLQTACDGGESDTAVYNDLVLRFHADRSRAEAGQTVRMEFSITNEGSQSYTMESKEIPVMDIQISEAGSTKVYASWSGQNPGAVSHRLEWRPGETKVIELSWAPQEGDVFKARHIIFLTGIMHEDVRGGVQSAGVSLCAEYC